MANTRKRNIEKATKIIIKSLVQTLKRRKFRNVSEEVVASLNTKGAVYLRTIAYTMVRENYQGYKNVTVGDIINICPHCGHVEVRFSYTWKYGLISKVCSHCKSVDKRKEFRPDETLQSMEWTHGLAAFRVKTWYNSFSELRERVEEVLNGGLLNVELACAHATQYCGKFGVYLRGEVKAVSNVDLWSEINAEGLRVFNYDEKKYDLIVNEEEIDFSLWDHMEAVVSPSAVTGWWIKEEFYNSEMGGELVEFLKNKGIFVEVIYEEYL